jgi:hypothetical protein
LPHLRQLLSFLRVPAQPVIRRGTSLETLSGLGPRRPILLDRRGPAVRFRRTAGKFRSSQSPAAMRRTELLPAPAPRSAPEGAYGPRCIRVHLVAQSRAIHTVSGGPPTGKASNATCDHLLMIQSPHLSSNMANLVLFRTLALQPTPNQQRQTRTGFCRLNRASLHAIPARPRFSPSRTGALSRDPTQARTLGHAY